MKEMVHCWKLDADELAQQERYGERLDPGSQPQRAMGVDPLVYGTLDLRHAYDLHVAGARRNAKARKIVNHFVVRFPREILAGTGIGPFGGTRRARQRAMLVEAVEFLNS